MSKTKIVMKEEIREVFDTPVGVQEDGVIPLKEEIIESKPTVVRDENAVKEENKEQIKKEKDSFDQQQKELEDTSEKLTKEEKEKMESRGKMSKSGGDGEALGAFLLIFSEFEEVFQKEAVRMKDSFSKEKIAMLENIKEEYKKNGEISKELLDKTDLSENLKNSINSFSQNIAKIDNSQTDENSLDTSSFFKELVSSGKRLIDNAKNGSVSKILSVGIIDELESPIIKDESVDKDTEREENRDRDFERLKNTQKLRVR